MSLKYIQKHRLAIGQCKSNFFGPDRAREKEQVSELFQVAKWSKINVVDWIEKGDCTSGWLFTITNMDSGDQDRNRSLLSV